MLFRQQELFFDPKTVSRRQLLLEMKSTTNPKKVCMHRRNNQLKIINVKHVLEIRTYRVVVLSSIYSARRINNSGMRTLWTERRALREDLVKLRTITIAFKRGFCCLEAIDGL